MKTSIRSQLPFLALALALVAGCHASAKLPQGADVEGLTPRGDRLATVNPMDVVVLPIENPNELADLPLEQLRADFHELLVTRRYSPLGLEYTDRRVVDAFYTPGDLQEQAVLKVVITGWDTSAWAARSRLLVEADVWLLDARDPRPEAALWGGHVSRRISMAGEAGATTGPKGLYQRAVRRFVEDVLASLPARDPRGRSGGLGPRGGLRGPAARFRDGGPPPPVESSKGRG